MSKKKTLPQPQPRALADFPSYVEAVEKLGELQAKQPAIEQAIQEARSNYRVPRDAKVGSMAQNILAGETAVAEAPPVDIEKLELERDALAEAVTLQKQTIRTELGKASTTICSTFRAEHNALSDAIVDCIENLVNAFAAEEGFVARLKGQGVDARSFLRVPNFANSPRMIGAIKTTNLAKLRRDNTRE